MTEKFSDNTLMAYADGELSAPERAKIEQALEGDATLASRLAAFSSTRQAASDAFKPLLDTPVPDTLKSSIEDMVARHEGASKPDPAPAEHDNVVAIASRPRFMGARLDLALAASIALVVGAAVGYLVSTSQTAAPPAGLMTADLSDPALVVALRTVPSGEERALEDVGRFRAIASFRDETEELCREFELDKADASTVVSVACQSAGQWQVRFTVVAGSANDGYAPASSLDALDAYLSAIGAGDPLSPDAEKTALQQLR